MSQELAKLIADAMNESLTDEEIQGELELLNLDENGESIEEEGEGVYLTSNGLLPPIVIEPDQYDSAELARGLNDISYTCGQIIGLMNTGVSEKFILEFLGNREVIEGNLKLTQENNKTQVEISKHQRVIVEKQDL